jgi:hypothetical protein
MRLFIKTNKDLDHYKSNQDFKNYIGTSGMVIEYNNLETANPINVGFLENIIARPETANLYIAKVEKLLPIGSPKFTITVQALHGPNKTLCRVFMIKCNKKNLSTLVKLLIQIDNPIIEFFHFSHS